MKFTQRFKKRWNLYFRSHSLGYFFLKKQKQTKTTTSVHLGMLVVKMEVIFAQCGPLSWCSKMVAAALNDPKTQRGQEMACMTPGPPDKTQPCPKSCFPLFAPPPPSGAAFSPWPLRTASPPRFCHNHGWWRLWGACPGSRSLSSEYSLPRPKR